MAYGGVLQILTLLESHFSVLASSSHWEGLIIKPFMVIVILMIIEAYVVGWETSSIKRLIKPSRSSRADIATFLLSIFRLTPLFQVVFTFGIVLLIRKALPSLPSIGLHDYTSNIVVESVMWIFIKDFFVYWMHRLSHKVSFLWEAHKFHHSATEFTMLSLNRLHPIELAYRSAYYGVVLGLLGISLETISAILLFEHIIDRINHSNLPWKYGWVGRWLIYSPHGHRVHHSVDPVHFNKNFGETTPLWDRLFGTWSGEQKDAGSIEIGIPNNIYNKNNFFYDYWLCFNNTMKALLKLLNLRNRERRMKSISG